MKFRSAFAVLSMTAALAACGELPFQKKAAEEPAAPVGHVGPPAVSPLQQPIETGGEAIPRATAEASTMNTAIFRAAGAGWVATASGKEAVYERPGAKSVGVSVRRLPYASGVEFVGTMNGSVFSLNIRAAACEAGDQKTPFTAQLRVGSQRLQGCATATDTMPKPQTRASSAAPKPKKVAPAAAPAKPKPAAAPVTPATTVAPVTTPATTAPAVEPPVTTPAATTPATALATTPAATVTTPVTSGVPAPQLVLPPTPPVADTTGTSGSTATQ